MPPFANYVVYGRKRGRPTQLAGEWDLAEAERQAELYRSKGWKDVVVKPITTRRGPILRFRKMQAPNGRWEMTFSKEDLDAIQAEGLL